jgi:hypothetical protein
MASTSTVGRLQAFKRLRDKRAACRLTLAAALAILSLSAHRVRHAQRGQACWPLTRVGSPFASSTLYPLKLAGSTAFQHCIRGRVEQTPPLLVTASVDQISLVHPISVHHDVTMQARFWVRTVLVFGVALGLCGHSSKVGCGGRCVLLECQANVRIGGALVLETALSF